MEMREAARAHYSDMRVHATEKRTLRCSFLVTGKDYAEQALQCVSSMPNYSQLKEKDARSVK